MKFPNAHSGVKKIFTAEVLSMISAIALLITAVLAFAADKLISSGAAETAAEEATGIAAALVIFGIVGSILMLIAFILNLAGIVSAMKDESSFKTALIFTIAGIAAAVLSSIFSKNDVVKDFTQIIVNFAEMMVAYHVVRGIVCLAVRLRDTEMVERGSKVIVYLMLAYFVPILIHFISVLFSMKEEGIVSQVLALIAAVLSLFVYFIYLGYLGRARKMLEG